MEMTKLPMLVVAAIILVSSQTYADEVKDNHKDKPLMKINWNKIRNPILDLEPEISARDPLLHYHDGVFPRYRQVKRPFALDGHSLS